MWNQIIGTVSNTSITVATVSTVNTLGVFFVTQNLHSPAQTYGLLGTAYGIGALIGAGLSAVFAGRFRAMRVYVYSFAAAGLLLIGYSRMTTVHGAIALLFLTGYWWARYTLSKPWLAGLVFLVIGTGLVAAAIALGG